MNAKWNFTPFRIVLLCCGALMVGVHIFLLLTERTTPLEAFLGILAMLFVSALAIVSSRVKTDK